MRVMFILIDKDGYGSPDENVILDLDSAQVTALLGSNHVMIPIKGENTTIKIKGTTFIANGDEPTLIVNVDKDSLE